MMVVNNDNGYVNDDGGDNGDGDDGDDGDGDDDGANGFGAGFKSGTFGAEQLLTKRCTGPFLLMNLLIFILHQG